MCGDRLAFEALFGRGEGGGRPSSPARSGRFGLQARFVSQLAGGDVTVSNGAQIQRKDGRNALGGSCWS